MRLVKTMKIDFSHNMSASFMCNLFSRTSIVMNVRLYQGAAIEVFRDQAR